MTTIQKLNLLFCRRRPARGVLIFLVLAFSGLNVAAQLTNSSSSLIEAAGQEWETVVEECDNGQRFRVHQFTPRQARAVRLTVLKVRDPHYRARVYEVRVYGPTGD